MLVEPTRVHPRRDRWLAVGALGFALMIVVVGAGLATTLTARPPAQTAPLGLSTALVGPSGPQEPRVATAVRSAELHATVVANGPGGGALLAFSGWVPTQFSWATIDVTAGERRVSGPGVRVTGEGSFSGTVDISPWGATFHQVVVRLSGLNDVQLFAVPLVTLVVGPSTVRPLRDARASVSR